MRWRAELVACGALAAGVAGGCGSDGSSASGSRPDASAGPSPEETDGASDLESCVLDAMSPDAFALNVDGSPATSACETCIVGNCGAELTACSSDCTCDPQLLAFVACAVDGGSALVCGVPLGMSDAPTAQALAQCVGGFLAGGTGLGCLQACGVGRTGSEAGASDAAAPDTGALVTDGATDLTDASAGD